MIQAKVTRGTSQGGQYNISKTPGVKHEVQLGAYHRLGGFEKVKKEEMRGEIATRFIQYLPFLAMNAWHCDAH